ncbi:MAG: hypothetical protein WAN36_07040 [Calditrichia bacterium]
MIAAAPGKLILLGEYAVLEGAAALVMAVNRFAKVKLTSDSLQRGCLVSAPVLNVQNLKFEISPEQEVIFPPEISSHVRQQMHFFSETVQYALTHKLYRQATEGVHFHLDTADFFLPDSGEKAGLGSSAALTTALLAALSSASDTALSPEALFPAALQAHHHAQGKIGSGIDVAASVFGGICRFQKRGPGRPQVQAVSIPAGLHFICIWSGRSASTRDLVLRVSQYKESHRENYFKIIGQMSETAELGFQHLQQNQWPQFLQALNEYGRLMDSLGKSSGTDIFSESHQEIAELVQSAGGVYKPSGAGGGDIGIAVTDSTETARAIVGKVLHSKYKIINLDPAANGVTLNQ